MPNTKLHYSFPSNVFINQPEGTTIPLRRITRRKSTEQPVQTSPSAPSSASATPPVDDESSDEIPAFAYGRFTFDYAVNFAGLSLAVEQSRGMYHYHRAIGKAVREATISSSAGARMIIHPVEPLYVPDPVTDFLEIKFSEIMIEPNGKTVIFLTFPIEIGVFIESKGETDVIDVFTFKQPKYSMYGSSHRGVITKWHKSQVHAYPPQVKNYEEGVLRLTIQNTTDEWVYVSRVIIYEKGMFIHYDDSVVSMAAEMTILNRESADVAGVDRPLRPEMSRSIRLYKPRKMSAFSNVSGSLVDTVFTMDLGLI
ncbi:DUF432 domain-containing protein [Methanorbis furvi]|uniref:DUF432 domain-containing protein n=1 Tax=Methanorbis furvi TaxID=3028299 RepID=UPI0030B89808